MSHSYSYFASQGIAQDNTLTTALNAYKSALEKVEQISPIYSKRQELLRLRQQAAEDLSKYNNNQKKRTKLLDKLYNNLNESTLLLSALNQLSTNLLDPNVNTFTSPAYQSISDILKSDYKRAIAFCYREALLLANTLISKPHNADVAKEMGLLTTTIESINNLYKDPSNLNKLASFTGIISTLPEKLPAWQRLAGALIVTATTAIFIATAPFIVAVSLSGAAIAAGPIVMVGIGLLYLGLNLMFQKNHFFYKSGLPVEMTLLQQAAQNFQANLPGYSAYAPLPISMISPSRPVTQAFYQPAPAATTVARLDNRPEFSLQYPRSTLS